MEFARNYLHKLVNLEVSIRPPRADQVRSLLTLTNPNITMSAAEEAFRWLRRQAFAIVALLMVVGGVTGYFAAERSTPVLHDRAAKIGNRGETTQPASASFARSKGKDGKIIGLSKKPPPVKPTSSFVREGAPANVRNWWYGLFGLFLIPLLAISAWVLTRRPDVVVEDSPRFRAALELWCNSIAAQYRTPRELKRFLNFVRYMAMRWRKPKRTRTPIEKAIDRLSAKWRRLPPAAQEPLTDNQEAEIVCMATLAPLCRGRKVDYEELRRRVELVGANLDEHYQAFGSLPDREDWNRYYDISGEVQDN